MNDIEEWTNDKIKKFGLDLVIKNNNVKSCITKGIN